VSEIRKYMVSRFMKGRILELDYSQLEIFVLAHLSDDSALKKDLLSGTDIHGKSARRLFGSGYTKKQRKIAKQLSFQLQYGAGYKSMALSNAIPEAQAKKFIENYYTMYPGVEAYHARMQHEIEVGRRTTDKRSKKGYPVGVSKIQSETGRIYTYTEQDAPDFMANPKFPGVKPKKVSFSPTKIKNYQNQGYATGDIVPLVLGHVWRRMNQYNLERGNLNPVCIVNTVHDSIVFDCPNEVVALDWAESAAAVMRDAPKLLKEVLGVEFTMPLNVEAEIGHNWLEMEEITI
jgi:DNA polymerase I-like protein with 3'-5' exonuclease and polymerase domains